MRLGCVCRLITERQVCMKISTRHYRENEILKDLPPSFIREVVFLTLIKIFAKLVVNINT